MKGQLHNFVLIFIWLFPWHSHESFIFSTSTQPPVSPSSHNAKKDKIYGSRLDMKLTHSPSFLDKKPGIDFDAIRGPFVLIYCLVRYLLQKESQQWWIVDTKSLPIYHRKPNFSLWKDKSTWKFFYHFEMGRLYFNIQ